MGIISTEDIKKIGIAIKSINLIDKNAMMMKYFCIHPTIVTLNFNTYQMIQFQ